MDSLQVGSVADHVPQKATRLLGLLLSGRSATGQGCETIQTVLLDETQRLIPLHGQFVP
jgi:hypothetical protein